MSAAKNRPFFVRTPPLLALISWFLPGLGLFLVSRRWRKRAILFFVVVHVTFLLGVLLHGGITWPVWTPRHAGFSIINNLNFVLQMGGGWLALVSLWATSAQIPVLGGVSEHAFFELGSFYCMTAGALNYFIVWHTLDRRDLKLFERLSER